MAMNPRLLRPLATGFNPRQISGLALWLDASDASTLYTTSEGPVAPVSSPLDIAGCVGWWDASDASTFTLDGSGNVETWADKTNQGNDLTQATAANRPSVTAAAVNGLPAVTFDGSNDTLRTGAISLTQPFQYYLVFRFESAYTSGAPRIVDAGTQPSPGRGGEFFRQNTNDVRLYSGSTVTAGSVPAGQLEQFNLWSISFGGASDSFIRYKGGEYQVSTTAGTLDGSRITLGGDSNATASSHSNISVAELVLVSGALSAAERASLERYFAIKYGFDTVHAPATTASDPVGYWKDRSGNGLIAATSDATKRPVIATVNGRRAADFDGANDTLIINGYTAENGLTGLTRFAVAYMDANVSTILSTTSDAGINYKGGARFIDAQSGNVQFAAGNSGFTVGSVNVANANYTLLRDAPHVLGSTYDGTKATLQEAILAHYDGATLTPTSTTGALYSPLLSGGTRLHIGSNVNANNWWNGKICEYLVYTRVLTPAQRRKVEGHLAWKWGLQAQLPYNHPYAKSFPGFGSQTLPTDPDAQTYLAAVAAADGTGVEVGVANAVDDFVKGCKSDGIWNAIKSSCILAGARTLAGALVPLVGTAPTNNNFVSGDYNRETGLVGNGSDKYLDTNRAGNADPQDDAHFSAHVTAVATQGGSGTPSWFPIHIGAGTGSTVGTRNFGIDATGDNGTVRHTSQTSDAITGIRTATGFIGTSRDNASDFLFRLGGSTLSPISRASESPISGVNFAVFRALGGTAPNNVFFNGRLAFYSIGESLDLADLDTRVSRLIASVTFALNTGLSPQGYDTDTINYINAGYAAGGSLA